MNKKLIKKSIILGSIISLFLGGIYSYNEILPRYVISKSVEMTSTFSKTDYVYRMEYYNGNLEIRIKSNNISNTYGTRRSLSTRPKDILTIELVDKNEYPVKIVNFDLEDISIADNELKAVKRVKIGTRDILRINNCTFSTREVLIRE